MGPLSFLQFRFRIRRTRFHGRHVTDKADEIAAFIQSTKELFARADMNAKPDHNFTEWRLCSGRWRMVARTAALGPPMSASSSPFQSGA